MPLSMHGGCRKCSPGSLSTSHLRRRRLLLRHRLVCLIRILIDWFIFRKRCRWMKWSGCERRRWTLSASLWCGIRASSTLSPSKACGLTRITSQFIISFCVFRNRASLSAGRSSRKSLSHRALPRSLFFLYRENITKRIVYKVCFRGKSHLRSLLSHNVRIQGGIWDVQVAAWVFDSDRNKVPMELIALAFLCYVTFSSMNSMFCTRTGPRTNERALSRLRTPVSSAMRNDRF